MFPTVLDIPHSLLQLFISIDFPESKSNKNINGSRFIIYIFLYCYLKAYIYEK